MFFKEIFCLCCLLPRISSLLQYDDILNAHLWIPNQNHLPDCHCSQLGAQSNQHLDINKLLTANLN